MKVAWGWIETKDGGGTTSDPNVIVTVSSQFNDKNGPQRDTNKDAWAYLTPSQARKVAARLIKWADLHE